MDNDVHSRLVTKLLEIQGMHDYNVRTSLILNIPNQNHLTRHSSDARADVTFIVSGLAGMYSSEDGKWALSIFIDNALQRVSGTILSTELQELKHLLEAKQSAKKQSGEVHEEEAKQENPPDTTSGEIAQAEDQPGDPPDALFQQVQLYHSQVADTQKQLLEAQGPLDTISKLFRAGKGIKQDQCDKAIRFINHLHTPLLEAHALYDKASNSQGSFPLLSFPIKVVLNDIDDQIDELTSNLRMFCDDCPVSLIGAQTYQSDNEREKTENNRKKIAEQLDTLLEALKEINTMLHKFLESQPVI